MNKIIINNLNVYYDTLHALKNINLEIKDKNITSFIGPSGCGKSSLLKTINRMNDLVEDCSIGGSVIIDEVDIYNKEIDINKLRREVGMVFQEANLFPMSVYDNIAFGPRTHGIKDKSTLDYIVESSLKKASIWNEVKDRLNKNALSFSGGQQQRICIARSLAVKPKILLMDEPTSALDPISTSKIEDLILDLKSEYTVIIVTHNMQQSARISDYTGFFLNGELVEFDLTKKIFTRPKDKKTEAYITGRFG